MASSDQHSAEQQRCYSLEMTAMTAFAIRWIYPGWIQLVFWFFLAIIYEADDQCNLANKFVPNRADKSLKLCNPV